MPDAIAALAAPSIPLGLEGPIQAPSPSAVRRQDCPAQMKWNSPWVAGSFSKRTPPPQSQPYDLFLIELWPREAAALLTGVAAAGASDLCECRTTPRRPHRPFYRIAGAFNSRLRRRRRGGFCECSGILHRPRYPDGQRRLAGRCKRGAFYRYGNYERRSLDPPALELAQAASGGNGYGKKS